MFNLNKQWLQSVTGDSGEPGTGGGDDEPRVFTQEEVNSIAAKEKARAQRATTNEYQEKWAEHFGEADFDTVAERLRAVEEAEAAKKTEAEKERDDAVARAEKAEALTQQAAVELHNTRVQTAILAANGDSATADRVARLVDVETGATVDEIKAAVEAVKTDFPALFGQTPAPNTDPGNPGGTPPVTDKWAAGRERAKQRYGGA